MFDFVRNHQRLMMGIIGLIILPSFILVGVSAYQSGGFSDTIATVGDQKISQGAFDEALRAEIDRARDQLGDQFDQAMFETPEARQRVLDRLVNQAAVRAEIDRNHIGIGDSTLKSYIHEQLGDPSGTADITEQYRAAAAAQGLTTAGLDRELRTQLALSQLVGAVQDTAFAPQAVASRISDLREQEREVQEMMFPASKYAAQAKVTDAMVKAFYDKNQELFKVPERARIEYVVFDASAVASQVSVTDAEIAKYYQDNQKRFSTGEQRRAAHILINAPQDAAKAEKDAARARAQALLEQLRKNPASFAELAKANSQDPGSAEQGGDLGVVEKGLFVKPVEDAIFALKQGEISGVVESEYGYHIITVPELKAATVRPLEEVKAQIATDLQQSKMSARFSQMAEEFSDLVYEQADSLKPAADKLKLEVRTADNISRTPNPMLGNEPYNNPKFLKALFAKESLQKKENTDAIEVAPQTLVAGRVVEYKAAAVRPLAEVEPMIRARVQQEEELRLAKAEGEAKLAALRASGDTTGFGAAQIVSRTAQPAIAVEAALAVLKADVSKLPAYVGVDVPGVGYGIYRINKVRQSAPDVERRKQELQQVGGVLAQQETFDYVEALKQKAKVKVKRPVTALAAQPATAD